MSLSRHAFVNALLISLSLLAGCDGHVSTIRVTPPEPTSAAALVSERQEITTIASEVIAGAGFEPTALDPNQRELAAFFKAGQGHAGTGWIRFSVRERGHDEIEVVIAGFPSASEYPLATRVREELTQTLRQRLGDRRVRG